jgi:predicted transcriptional regulator
MTSGQVLRQARHRAWLTQAELAARDGTTQSVISVYESNGRQPALATSADLIRADGLKPDVADRFAPDLVPL